MADRQEATYSNGVVDKGLEATAQAGTVFDGHLRDSVLEDMFHVEHI